MKPLQIKKTIIGVIAFCIFISGRAPTGSKDFTGASETMKDSSELLKEIYREVKELGKCRDDDFIMRQFFVGQDDDDTNKDIHVFILIQKVEGKEKITIQVTYMQRSKGKPAVGYAKKVMSISYILERDKVDIIRSDYDERESKSLFPEVLRAIRDKKKLLKLLDQKEDSSSSMIHKAQRRTRLQKVFHYTLFCKCNKILLIQK